MGYVESDPLFCVTIETIKYRATITMHKSGEARVHYLENLMETLSKDQYHIQKGKEESTNKSWDNTSTQTKQVALAHVKVNLDDFIIVVQG